MSELVVASNTGPLVSAFQSPHQAAVEAQAGELVEIAHPAALGGHPRPLPMMSYASSAGGSGGGMPSHAK